VSFHVQVICCEQSLSIFHETVLGAYGDEMLEADVGFVVLKEHQSFLALVLVD
jgi:hypothetical protein